MTTTRPDIMDGWEVEWCNRQHFDKSGEWDPDADEVEFRDFRTKEAAEKFAIKQPSEWGICLMREFTHEGDGDEYGRFWFKEYTQREAIEIEPRA